MRKTPQSLARLLITGGGGLLGRELVRRAPARGWEVRATWWSSRPELPADWVHADVRDGRRWRRRRGNGRRHPHRVPPGRRRMVDERRGLGGVARAAAGVRLIHLSTDLVFDGLRGRYREDDAFGPVSAYGRSKAEAERRVARRIPPRRSPAPRSSTAVPRPGRRSGSRARGTTFFVDEIRSPVRVGDLAEALLELLPLELPGPLHLGGEDDVSRYDFAVALGADPARHRARAHHRRSRSRRVARQLPRTRLCSGRASAASTTAARPSVRRGSRRSPPAAARRRARRAVRTAQPGRDNGRGRGSRCRPGLPRAGACAPRAGTGRSSCTSTKDRGGCHCAITVVQRTGAPKRARR